MTLMKMAFSVIGIYTCFLTWGVLQERVSTTPYVDGKSKPERFKYFLFLNMIQSTMASVVAVLYLWITGRRVITDKRPVLIFRYLQFAALGSIASFFGYQSLKHIDYPTLTLGKSCKLIPVMLMNIILYRKKFPLYKYIVVALITLGVSSFTLFQPQSEKKQGNSSNSLYGIMLLLINQVIDGFVNSTQDQVFHTYKITGQQMMFFMNIFTTLLLFLWLSMPWSQELGLAIAFCQRHPAVLTDIFLFVLFGALGQCFIFFTLENFESLVLVTITVTRKLFTMLLSVFLFDHHLSRNQWFAVGLVFTGIGLEAYVKQAEKTRIADRVSMSHHGIHDDSDLNGYAKNESTDRKQS